MAEMPNPEETQELFIAQLQSELEKARREALAAQHGIPQELIALLRAEDPDQLAQDAATLARALKSPRQTSVSAAHAAEPAAPDLSWLRDRRSGRANPFGRGGVRWSDGE
ncbi:MAG: hypothetical protein CUN51_06575 [Candidatus Thermofonsia Clade 1 bacterium]|uniref:Uncharacterized protein n=1 Tax=Candidatus Thermofonsia Clade 1 bacterium TaxID=2364210 RepID=A0A2M8NZX3_9CHLR|nr:MAG: hypothetical protein CUN51_06575 [Candidatus Thermofonsia Clade 1 bacterium]